MSGGLRDASMQGRFMSLRDTDSRAIGVAPLSGELYMVRVWTMSNGVRVAYTRWNGAY